MPSTDLPVLEKPDFPVAHTPRRGDKARVWHRYEDHVRGVVKRAEEFASPFGGEVWARYAGLIHDIGKLDVRFQNYLWDCHIADITGDAPPQAGSAPHKQAGALAADEALKKIGRQQTLSPLVQGLFGHHGAMLDPVDSASKMWEYDSRAKEKYPAVRAKARAIHPDLDPPLPPASEILRLLQSEQGETETAREMFFRFIFSCLTDADSLDTEAHLNPDEARRRKEAIKGMPPLALLCDRMKENQETLIAAGDREGTVNRVRRAVYDDCRQKAKEFEAGRVVTLTVPTGGGKTRSSLAFALEHAAAQGLERVIYAIPFTSIVDQTTAVFEKDIFDGIPGAVLEHHSAIEPPEDEAGRQREGWRRLAAQNWDSARIVVTTTVQLFESLLGNRPGKCRKLHRLAKSVIVLDEVQALPADLLQPLVNALRLLADQYGTTVVLCTATQPALAAGDILNPAFRGFAPAPEEINSRVKEHFQTLRRVTYSLEGLKRDEKGREWSDIASEMRSGGSALCIVNTRRQALDLLRALDTRGNDPSVFHLSTLMCGKHRRKVLETVRDRLQKNQPVLLASTQLVEAGIDLNFPRVFRALGPLPAIIQAAGRCNREGKRRPEESPVVVFRPADDSLPPDLYRLARQHTEKILGRIVRKGGELDLDSPKFITDWFTSYYDALEQHVDRYDIERDRAAFRYKTVAENSRLIRTETVPVLVMTYEPAEAQAILTAAETFGRMTDTLWRRAQRLIVNVFERDAERLGLEKFEVEGKFTGLRLWPGAYDARTGLAALVDDPGSGFAYGPGGLVA